MHPQIPTIELVIFDCDGVLVDTEPIAAEHDSEAFGALGWPITPHEVMERFLGRSNADMFAEVEAELGITLTEEWRSELERTFWERLRRELQPIEGAPEATAIVAEGPWRICVASSGRPQKIRFTLTITGLIDRFDPHLFSATQVERGKPHPDLFLFAANQMGVDPSACVVVEDSPAGVAAGLAAGMRVLAYDGGFSAPHLSGVPDHPALRRFSRMHELPDLLRA